MCFKTKTGTKEHDYSEVVSLSFFKPRVSTCHSEKTKKKTVTQNTNPKYSHSNQLDFEFDRCWIKLWLAQIMFTFLKRKKICIRGKQEHTPLIQSVDSAKSRSIAFTTVWFYFAARSQMFWNRVYTTHNQNTQKMFWTSGNKQPHYQILITL